MIVLPIIRNLGGLKKIRPKRPTKISRNDPGRNDPGPKRPRAETTLGQNDPERCETSIIQIQQRKVKNIFLDKN